MIEVETLYYDYPRTRVLEGLSIHVAEGAIAALVGPNGAGKTTLMRCLAGLARPLSGDIRVAGRDLRAEPRAAADLIGFLPDRFGLYDDLEVRRHLEFRARAQGMSPEAGRAAVAEMAMRLGLERYMNQRAGALSRGWRQRLAIAMTILHSPRLLLLDEPMAGLDPGARSDLARLIRDLGEAGFTLMISSHILSELEDYASDLIALDQGRILGEWRLGEEGDMPVLLRLQLAAPAPAPEPVLMEMDGIRCLRRDEDTLLIQAPRGAAARHRLLAALIEAGVPVAGLERVRDRFIDIFAETGEATPAPGAMPREPDAQAPEARGAAE